MTEEERCERRAELLRIIINSESLKTIPWSRVDSFKIVWVSKASGSTSDPKSELVPELYIRMVQFEDVYP